MAHQRPILQGKMTRVKPKGANIKILPLPLPISKHHKDLQFYTELFFVNGHPFLSTKTNKVNFITAGTSHTTKTIVTFLHQYEAICLNITAVCGEN